MTYKDNLPQEIKTGDLVYHLLYGRSWSALFLEYGEFEPTGLATPRQMCLVHMLPGTEYEFFFKKNLKRYRITDKMGYVSLNWLRILNIK